ncbi:E3 SUMO-protein ligase NSE2-like [Nymphalis io]|uniref:E3 SUMO-protein ligase NSE2-like n=1 Tax=Inachis io TaxID=171585 RepID=UPI002169AEF4|nr:E3 SUMO-protein ligase NSE2-like [Nymphalis io]
MSESDITEIRKQCIDSLLLCADNVSKYVDTGKDVELNKLRKYIQSYCFSEAQQNVEAMALQEVKDSDISDLNKLDEVVRKRLIQITQNTDISSHPLVIEFDKRIERNTQIVAQNLDESCVTITQAEENNIDPITLKPIENPVRNKICKHVYERDVILKHIQRKQGAKCPVAGCVSQQPLRSENLISDEEFRTRMSIPQNSNVSQEELDTAAVYSQEY